MLSSLQRCSNQGRHPGGPFFLDPALVQVAASCVRPGGASVLEASGAALHFVRYKIGPHELDHARIVIAVREIMVQRGEAMLLTGLFHGSQLA